MLWEVGAIAVRSRAREAAQQPREYRADLVGSAVLVLDQADWPTADGTAGITSSDEMDAVEAAGRAIEVGSNFFLFFSSKLSSAMSHHR
jgi:hypothetical protein